MLQKYSHIFTVTLFTIFFLFITFGEDTYIQKTRNCGTIEVVDHVAVEEISDETAPIGKKQIYTFSIEHLGRSDNSLAFYLVHQFADVYLDGELVYSLGHDPDSKIGKSPSSNWVIIPLYQEDKGSEVLIEVTPVYPAVKDRAVEILVGSHFNVLTKCLLADLPALIISCMCILLGVIILLVRLVNRNIKYWNIYYLGMLSLWIGIWKFCDLPVAPLFFPNQGRGIGYVALGSIFIIGMTVLHYTKNIFIHVHTPILDKLNATNYIIVLVLLLLQVLNILDLREVLFLAHIGLIAIIIIIIGTAINNREYFRSNPHPKMMRFFVIGITVALLSDMFVFYTAKDGYGMFGSLLMFFIYSAVSFITLILDSSRKMYTDTMTGLFNKTRWNESVTESIAAKQVTAIAVLDLNQLKKINDLFGHDIGDQLIYNFATILKQALPENASICRWGGDEFAVMLNDVSHEDMNKILQLIENAVSKYNLSEAEPKISYSAGYALSSDYRSITSEQLFKLADEKMYQKKQEWYRTHKQTESVTS